jgi:hypothetical protein
MIVKLVSFTVATCSLASCHTTQQPITRDALVGIYAYVSEDPESRAADHNFNRLILRSDGTYDLVEGGTAKVISEKKGVWRIAPGSPKSIALAPARPGTPSRWTVTGSPPNVLLDGAGYPIEIEQNEVRLLVDLDVGIWWVKAK